MLKKYLKVDQYKQKLINTIECERKMKEIIYKRNRAISFEFLNLIDR